jgi:hypothetical protein
MGIALPYRSPIPVFRNTTMQPIPTRAERMAIAAALEPLTADWSITPLVRLEPRRRANVA